jgi:hypothetical protein
LEEFEKKMKKMRIMTLIVGQDGIARRKQGVKVEDNGLVAGKYTYRSDAVYYTRSMGVFLTPTLLYDENEIEPIYVRGKMDYNKRTVEKTAAQFGLMIEDAGFAMFEILRKKSTQSENLMLGLLAGILVINVVILFGLFM